MAGRVNPRFDRVQGSCKGWSLQKSTRSINGPNCANRRVRRLQEKKFKIVATASVQDPELEVMCICNSVMSRHRTHGRMGMALDAHWLARDPQSITLAVHTEG
jgi:hypothetical protein